MAEQKTVTPLKVGLLVVAAAYFLYTFHAMFVLSWIGEWQGLPQPTATWILITDVSAYTFLVFRLIGSALAFAAAALYISKKLSLTTQTKILRVVLVFEALYWIGLLPSGVWGLVPSSRGINTAFVLNTGIPCTFGSLAIPIALFVTAYKLKPATQPSKIINWAMLAGVFYIVEFWLNNSGMWLDTWMAKGTSYLTANPQYLLSFLLTTVGLLALAIYAGYFAKKSSSTLSVEGLKLRNVGAIILALGLFYLWNYQRGFTSAAGTNGTHGFWDTT